ncbi:hypothetical protein AALD01_05870 [Oscillospiraceae bacterium 21-37]
MKKTFTPEIGMFSPFEEPFAAQKKAEAIACIVDPRVFEYMLSENTKVVAKCTPCQCCACR